MTRHARVVAVTHKWHGLGNRVRVVLGSRSLARFEHRAFSYVWPVGPTFGARFDDLWSIDDPVTTTVSARLSSVRHGYRDHTLEWLDDEARRDRTWLIRTPHALHLPVGATAWEDDLRALSPVPQIAERVRRFHADQLGAEPYVGVMVRAHAVSHDQTRRDSPLQWYIDRLAQIRRQSPDLRIFISADTPESQAAITAAVPGVVGQHDKGPYNSRSALTAAVADLYLLAGSVHLIGPHYSSFPELAQKLAGPGLHLETSKTAPEVRFERVAHSRPVDPVIPHERSAVDLG